MPGSTPVVLLGGNPNLMQMKAVVVWNAVVQVEVELPTYPGEAYADRRQRALRMAVAKAEEFTAAAWMAQA